MRCRLLGLTIAAALFVPASGNAQDLIFDLFREYIDSLRDQAGIPGLSVAIVGDNEILWEQAFGLQDVERALPVRTDTPFHLDGITQVVTTTLLLRCAEEGRLALDDPIGEPDPESANPAATVRELLSHTSQGSGGAEFSYRLARFDTLTPLASSCSRRSFHRSVGRLFDSLGAIDTSPGPDVADRFTAPGRIERYERVLERIAAPYVIGRDQQPFASEHPATTLSATGGLVSSVRDLALFDIELRTGVLIRPDTLSEAWVAPLGPDSEPLPHGLGWFVQTYAGEPIAWQFGMAENASSSLIVVAPTHGLTLILLANSDGLARSLGLETGDLTLSPFARVFLELFLR